MKICTEDRDYLKRYGFANGLRRIAELGFECIDYQEFCDTDKPLFQLSPADFEQELKRQRREIEALGLSVNQTHGPWRYPIQDATAADRQERFDKMTRSLLGTALLGCRNMIIHPIMPFGDEDGLHADEAWKMNLEFMGRLTEVARQHGVTLCLENMPFRFQNISTPMAVRKLAEQINSPDFRVCLDTGHAMVMGIQPALAVRQLGAEYLRTLHVHDNNGERDSHWLPYTGKVDWEAFASALQEIGYQGAISLETAIPATIPEELAPLQQQSLVQMAKRLAGRL